MNHNDLKNFLSKRNLSQTNALLLILATDDCKPKKNQAIVQTAEGAGLRAVRKWNVSARLGASGGKAVNTPTGWELTDSGKVHIQREFPTAKTLSPTATAASRLAVHLSKIRDQQVRSFVEEAVVCLEHGHLRAAVVLSWVGAVAQLQQHVASKELVTFNCEARRRNAKWKDAQTTDDLSNLDEYEFLQILASISVVGKSVKQRLEQALRFRNGAGHPNQLIVAEHDAAAHVEALIKNVFEKFV